jgi:hypothetical protein
MLCVEKITMHEPSDAAQGAHGDSPQLASPVDASLQALLREVNQQTLESLARAAHAAPAQDASALLSVLRELLTPEALAVRQRAAHCPVLLVNLNFEDHRWWQTLAVQPRLPPDRHSLTAFFPLNEALRLMRAALIFAWHIARTDPEAGLALGIAPHTALVIAQLSLSDLEDLAAHQFMHLRPRWETRPPMWRKLMQAAAADEPQAFDDIVLQSWQLLIGDLLPYYESW